MSRVLDVECRGAATQTLAHAEGALATSTVQNMVKLKLKYITTLVPALTDRFPQRYTVFINGIQIKNGSENGRERWSMTQMKDGHKNNVNTGECMFMGSWQARKRMRLGKKTVIGDGVLAKFCGRDLGKWSRHGTYEGGKIRCGTWYHL